MRDYNNSLFNKIVGQVNKKGQSVVDINVSEKDILFLQYRLTRDFYYAVIVDDYPFEIVDKNSLLEALYYQVKLITVHGLNWDAIQEGFEDVLDDFIGFEGVCLLFKDKQIRNKISNELVILENITREINKQSKQKQIKILLNQ